jgi:iron complex transport system ATP-binding protein
LDVAEIQSKEKLGGWRMNLEVKDLVYSYGENQAVDHVSLHVETGEFVGLIGPNGSGKSTVLKNIYRALVPREGEIFLDGQSLSTLSYRESALKMAVVGQENQLPFDFTVEEIVAMGRSPHKRWFEPDTPCDRQIVRRALHSLGMEELADRNYARLSGGEKQRVLIARAMAQECDFWILDEPTNHLDIGYQMQIFDLIRQLKVTVLSAIHDLNLAALYCDRLYVLKQGRVVMDGPPENILTPENIHSVYGASAAVETHPLTGKPSVTLLPTQMNAERRSL